MYVQPKGFIINDKMTLVKNKIILCNNFHVCDVVMYKICIMDYIMDLYKMD